MKQLFKKFTSLIASVTLLFIFGICVTNPSNNLIPAKILLYTLVMLAIILVLSVFVSKITDLIVANRKIKKSFLPVFFVLYSLLLFALGIYLRTNFPSTDYEMVYEYAGKLATGEGIDDWTYFAYCYNNVGPLVYLACIFRLASFFENVFPFDVYYVFGLIHNIISIDLLLLSVMYISGSSEKAYRQKGFVITAALLYVPFYVSNIYFYSDQFSLGYAFYAIAFLTAFFRKNNYLFLIPAGGATALGYILKPTSLIPLIGFAVAFFVCRFKKNTIKVSVIKTLLFFIGAFIAVNVVYGRLHSNLPDELSDKSRRMPVEAFVVMGLNGDGSYAENQEFYLACMWLGGDERVAFARENVLKSLPNLLNFDHILRKTRRVFSDGSMGSTLLGGTYYENSYRIETSVLRNLVSDYGEYIWYFYNYSTAVMYSFYILLALSGLWLVLRRDKSTPEDFMIYATLISFLGYIIFMTFWEGQAKQFYNQSGIFVLGLSLIMNRLSNILLSRRRGVKVLRTQKS